MFHVEQFALPGWARNPPVVRIQRVFGGVNVAMQWRCLIWGQRLGFHEGSSPARGIQGCCADGTLLRVRCSSPRAFFLLLHWRQSSSKDEDGSIPAVGCALGEEGGSGSVGGLR